MIRTEKFYTLPSAMLICAAITLGLCACDPASLPGDPGDKAATRNPLPPRSTVYDPSSPDDKRPTVPSTSDIPIEDMNGGGNMGIVIPEGRR